MKINQKHKFLNGNLKYTKAKADSKEITIFPTVIPIAIIAELIIICITGTRAPYPSGAPLNKALA